MKKTFEQDSEEQIVLRKLHEAVTENQKLPHLTERKRKKIEATLKRAEKFLDKSA